MSGGYESYGRDGRAICKESGKWVIGVRVPGRDGSGGLCDHRGLRYESRAAAIRHLVEIRAQERGVEGARRTRHEVAS